MMKKLIFGGLLLLMLACQNKAVEKSKSTKVLKTEQQADLWIEYEFDTLKQKKDGYYKEYSLVDGKKVLFLEKTIKDGLNSGEEKQYHPNGQLAASFQYNEKGQLEGPFKYYFPDAQLKQSGSYQADALTDTLKTYYPNGGLKERVFMVDNLANGPFEEFYQNGQLKAKGLYVDNIEHCELWIYDQDSTGKLESKMLCDSQLKTCATFWKAKEGPVEGVNDFAKSTIEKMRPQCEPLK